MRGTGKPSSRLGLGTPLPEAARDWFEERYDADFSAVRIHAGPSATALVESYGALAFTFGSHIVVSPRIGPLSSPFGRLVLAHELAHSLQQAAAPTLKPEAQHWPRGPPSHGATDLRVRGRSALGVQCFPDITLPTIDDVTGAVVSAGEGAWDTVADVGGAAADFAAESLASVVDYFAPGLLTFLRGGYAGQLSDLFCSGLDALVGALLSPLEEIDIVAAVQETFTTLDENVRRMWSDLGKGATAALGALLKPLVEALDVYGDPIIQGLSDAVDTADGIFSSLWENIGVPVLDFLESVGGAVWKGFNDTIAWLEEITGPLRAAAEDAWDWLCAQFDLAWESTGGIRQWLSDQASTLWDSFLETIEPIKEPVLAVAGVLVLLSPLGPIVILTQVIPPLWEKIVWLWNNWNSEDILVAAREILANEILPGVIGLVSGVASAISGAASWLAEITASVATTFGDVLGVFGANSCLATVTRVLNHVADEFQRLADWAEEGFTGLGDAVRAVFDALAAIFQPILDFLVRLIMVALNPPLLPIAITAAIWLFCPDDLKPPVISFVLDFLIQFIRGFPAFLTGLGPLASLMKSATLGFLDQLQSEEDPTKVAASNKVANIAAGGGPQFVAGYAIGLLEGIIDGILDPIRLVGMLVEVIGAITKAIGDRLAPLVFGGVPPLGAAVGAVREVLAIPPPVAASQGVAEGGGPAEVASAELFAAAQTTVPAGVAEGAAAVRKAPTRELPGGAALSERPNPSAAEAPPPVEERFGAESARESGVVADRIRAGRGHDSARSPPSRAGEDTAVRRDVVATGPVEERPVETIPLPATPGNAIEETAPEGDADIPAPAVGEGLGGAGAEAAEFEVLPGDEISDEALALAVSPGTITGVSAGGAELSGAAGDLESSGETEAREAGSSVSGLAGLLSDAWDQIIAGARGLGGRVADAFLRFLKYSDYVIGNKIGYVAGLVLLEVLLTFFTAGAWLEAAAAFKFLRPIVNLIRRGMTRGRQLLGAVARGVRTVRGPLMRGLSAARGFLGRFRVVRAIIDKLESVLEALFRFGDEAAGAGSRAGREAVEAAGGRTARETAETAGEQAGRRVDDAGRHADEAADASRRSAREAAERRAATAVARGIVRANDRVDTPVPLLLAQLNTLRVTYRWIDGFRAQRRGAGRYRIDMIASTTELGTYDLDDETSFEFEGQRVRFEASDRAPWRRARAEGRPVDLTEDLHIDIDEPLAVGAPGISRAEAMSRATDPMNRQFLESINNQITKHVRTEVPIHAPTPRPHGAPISIADNPAALVDRPLEKSRNFAPSFRRRCAISRPASRRQPPKRRSIAVCGPCCAASGAPRPM